MSEAGRVQGPTVADAVGETLAALGVDTVFGLIGSGNFVVTERLCACGAGFHAARHEGGATAMADGWARVTGRVGVVSVHQGPGLTNTLTALTEAAKSRTPLLVLAGDTPAAALRSNFRIDQHDMVASVGAVAERIHSAQSAPADAARALRRAALERRPVVLNLPIDLQAAPRDEPPAADRVSPPSPAWPAPEAVALLADAVEAAQRPVIVAGRGAVLSGARDALEALADRAGALLATSAVANGLFRGLAYDLGISGGFSSPLAAELIAESDLVLAFGATLNHWTTRHGALTRGARVLHVDLDPELADVLGDARATAAALTAELEARTLWRAGRRTPETAARIAAHRWRDEPYDERPAPGTIDPRTLSIAVDGMLPEERSVVVDSGHLTGWPAMYLGVPDARSWLFVNAFQAVGLGLGTALGAAVARPDRVTVAAVGDGGLFLALQELETAARLALPLLVLVYDDAAYGAEVHHFGPMGHDAELARFPDADLAAIARGAGVEAITVRAVEDLAPVASWTRDPRGPLLVDAKVDPGVRAEWLEEAFRAG